MTPYASRLRLVLADLATSEWLDAAAGGAPLDAIVSGYAIHHLPHARKRKLYAEVFDLLAPGGMFVNIEHVASASPWLEALSDDGMVDALHAFHSRRGMGKSRAQVADEFVHRPDKAANILAPVEVQCAWLREIGFQDVDVYFKVFELAVFGGRRPLES
jgi:SAM-dependent methyltransferase